MTIIAIRTVIIYLFLIVAMRLMGKRQIGELQPIELVVTLLVSDLAVLPMQETGMPLVNGLIPITLLIGLEILLSVGMLKNPFLSKLISGTPIVVVKDGKLEEDAMRKLRLTVEDLTEALREQNVFNLRDVQYAIVETSGHISVFLKADKQPATVGDVAQQTEDSGMPLAVITDGHISRWALSLSGKKEAWLERTLRKKKCTVKEVFLMIVDKNGQTMLLKKGEMQRREEREQS